METLEDRPSPLGRCPVALPTGLADDWLVLQEVQLLKMQQAGSVNPEEPSKPAMLNPPSTLTPASNSSSQVPSPQLLSVADCNVGQARGRGGVHTLSITCLLEAIISLPKQVSEQPFKPPKAPNQLQHLQCQWRFARQLPWTPDSET